MPSLDRERARRGLATPERGGGGGGGGHLVEGLEPGLAAEDLEEPVEDPVKPPKVVGVAR